MNTTLADIIQSIKDHDEPLRKKYGDAVRFVAYGVLCNSLAKSSNEDAYGILMAVLTYDIKSIQSESEYIACIDEIHQMFETIEAKKENTTTQ